MKSIRSFSLALLLIVPFFTGCDSSADGDEAVAMATLVLQPMVATTPLSTDLATAYTINGATLTFTTARMYLSDIVLVRKDGTTVSLEGEAITVPAKDANDNDIVHTVTDQIVLARHDLGEQRYGLGEVPSGEYTGIRYKVGIAGTDNRVDASQVPATHALAKQTDRNNHWNWNAGYQFLRIDGEVDTDTDGTPDEVWEVHLGTANFLTEVDLSLDFELRDGANVDLHIVTDYARFLQDVDLLNPEERLCHTMDNLPVANKVGAVIDDAFDFRAVRPAAGS